MRVEIVAPEEFMGDIIGDLNSRRGHVEGMENRDGTQIVGAVVPLASMFGYATGLRATQGRATSHGVRALRRGAPSDRGRAVQKAVQPGGRGPPTNRPVVSS